MKKNAKKRVFHEKGGVYASYIRKSGFKQDCATSKTVRFSI